MARARPAKTLLSSSARYAATTTGDGVDVSAWTDVAVELICGTITGAPTSLDVEIQGSLDGTNYGNFVTNLTFTQITTSTGNEVLRIPNLGVPWIRAVATIAGGTAAKTYTFSVIAAGKMG